MNLKKYCWLFVITLILSCHKKNEDSIYSVSYSIENGAKGAASSSLLISKDSTMYLWGKL